MIYTARSHGTIRFYRGVFGLALRYVPDAIRFRRADASEFPKHAETCAHVDADKKFFLKFRGGGEAEAPQLPSAHKYAPVSNVTGGKPPQNDAKTVLKSRAGAVFALVGPVPGDLVFGIRRETRRRLTRAPKRTRR